MITVAKFVGIVLIVLGLIGLALGIPILMEAGSAAAMPRFSGGIGSVYGALVMVAAGAAVYLLAVIADQLLALRAALVPEPEDWYAPDVPQPGRSHPAIAPPRARQ